MSMPTDKPRRRWLRFSLRSLFLLVVVIAVLLGWMIHKVRQQGVAVAALREMGCWVRYDYFPMSPTTLEKLKKLLGVEPPGYRCRPPGRACSLRR